MTRDFIQEQLLAAGLTDCAQACFHDYQQATANAPITRVWWQDRQQLRQLCDDLRFREPVRQALLAAADRIDREAPAWWTLLAVTDCLWRCPDDALRGRAIQRRRPSREQWGELADLFPALVYLTGLPEMVRQHRERGVPAQVTRDTADDLALWMEQHFHTHGAWGTADTDGWFNRHLRLALFALGRLQFEPTCFHSPYLVLRDTRGQIVALLEPGYEMRPDGQFAEADGGSCVGDAANWTTALTETEKAWVGHAIVGGRAERQPRSFSKDRWTVTMRRGDRALSVHIPARGKLDRAACVEAFARAEQFFPRCCPEIDFTGYFCLSWLMDPQLADVLDPDSNITRFQSLFTLLPFRRATDEQTLERVFGGPVNLSTAPRDTLLQRRVLAHMEAGGRWRSAVGVRLRGEASARADTVSSAAHGRAAPG